MRDPKKVEGGRALLFERLAGASGPRGEEEGARPFRIHEGAALKESVARELRRLLNTRSNLPLDSRGGELSVIDYGLPDFSSLSALSGDDRERLSALVTRAVAAFEPRLRDVRVTAERPSDARAKDERPRSNDRALILRLDATLVVGEHPEPVSFSLQARPGAGAVDVEEDAFR